VFKRQRPAADPATNPLVDYFYGNENGRLVHKWLHYFDIYHRHFAAYRDREVTVVEFGVSHGGSLDMWRHYFGPKARIVGVDIDPRCAGLAKPGVEVLIGDQGDPAFLRSVAERVGPIDVLIEDGGHEMHQQLATFGELWPVIRDGGVFLIEDLHTSYWSEYGGGYRRPGTFIEHAKTLVDSVNAWHSRDPESFRVDDHTRTVTGMHVYDSIVVLDKGVVEPPSHKMVGTPSWEA
jgi:cephalosporin hydroxylase